MGWATKYLRSTKYPLIMLYLASNSKVWRGKGKPEIIALSLVNRCYCFKDPNAQAPCRCYASCQLTRQQESMEVILLLKWIKGCPVILVTTFLSSIKKNEKNELGLFYFPLLTPSQFFMFLMVPSSWGLLMVKNVTLFLLHDPWSQASFMPCKLSWRKHGRHAALWNQF